MPAATLVPERGAIPYTFPAQVIRGFRLQATLNSPAEGADWSANVWFSRVTSGVDFVAGAVDAEDETARISSIPITIPFNEAPTLQAAVNKLQLLANLLVDEFIPSPGS